MFVKILVISFMIVIYLIQFDVIVMAGFLSIYEFNIVIRSMQEGIRTPVREDHFANHLGCLLL